jgi:hypothetical protein
VSRPPDLRELVGNDLSPAERERLERVHDLLVAAGPPPELPQTLSEPPLPEGRVVTLVRTRLRTGLVLAASLVIAAFAVGYFVGAAGEDSGRVSLTPERQVVLRDSGGRFAIVEIGNRDSRGNRPMVVRVEGLDHLSGGDYYTLFMTIKGKPVVTCGTFNVSDDGLTTVRFSIAYDPENYDGLMLAEYRRETHDEIPLLRARL